jgi:hypothetical protein
MYSLVSVHDCTVRCGERSLVVNNTPVENVLFFQQNQNARVGIRKLKIARSGCNLHF